MRALRHRFHVLAGALLALTTVAALFARESAPKPAAKSAAERIRAAGDAVQEFNLQHSLGPRLRKGLPIDELPDVTLAAYAREAAFYSQLLAGLADLDERSLAEEDAVTLAVLRHVGKEAVEARQFANLAFPVTPYSSPLRTVLQAFAAQPVRTAQDRQHYLKLLGKVPAWIGTMEAGLRAQAERHIVLAAPEIPLAAGPFAAATAAPASSPFGVTAARLEGVAGKESATFLAAVAEAIAHGVNPALQSLVGYLQGDYAKAAPAGVGLGQYPGGPEAYRFLVRAHTTLDRTPQEIHDIGLAEMDRIAKALDGVRRTVGFSGSLAEFRTFLRTDERFFPKTPEEIGARLMANQERILPRVGEFFGRTPKAGSGVERLAAALEGAMTFGYYDAPQPNRPTGVYYYNGSKVEQRSMLTSAALIAHELVPGHHFQIALQQENTTLPAFRQDYFTTAFVEGWGEYASDLAQQMGMYADPYDLAGRLMMDAHLSARLVVDTGMNALGWSRERASQYLSENTLLSDAEVATETLRYACDLPGQALAYKMGMRALVDLRERARRELGAKFDIRAFHDLVLSGGSLPLDVLTRRVDRWIASVRGDSAAPPAS